MVYIPLLFQLGKLTDCYTEDAERDRINKLPGTEHLTTTFKQFSGYLSVKGLMAQGEKTKNLHYWFVESMSSPSTDPIAFWTNGGPGKTLTFSWNRSSTSCAYSTQHSLFRHLKNVLFDLLLL